MNYHIELTEDQLAVVFTGLGEIKCKIAMPVVRVIEAQARQQREKPAAPEPGAPVLRIIDGEQNKGAGAT